MPPVVLIPVNRFDRAKGRLAEQYSAEERAQLAIATFETVARAVRDAGLLSVALTPDPEGVRALGVATEVIGESPHRQGLNGQLEGIVTQLGPEVLILHADLPLATGEAIAAFVGAAEEAEVALVRSRDGGTNAMLLRPPGRFALAYGPNSFAAHGAAARAAGLTVAHIESASLALDLDTPMDIEILLATAEGGATLAGRILSNR